MKDNKVFDPELDSMLASLQSDKMAEIRAENDSSKQLEHLRVVKEATEIRQNISAGMTSMDAEEKWLDRKTTNRQFAKDCLSALAIPVLGILGTLIGTSISARSNERIAEINAKERREELRELMKYEESDTVSRHELDVLNGLNKK